MRLLRRRSARSGRFTTPADAAANPDTTVTETVSDLPELVGRLRWRISDVEPALVQAATRMEQLARDLEHPEGDRVAGVISCLRYEAARARAVYDAKMPEEHADT